MNANRENDSYDVAIIGLGPIGLALATLLAAKGIRVAAIDPNRLVCQHPRATHIDDETMRTLQTLGADLRNRILAHDGIYSSQGRWDVVYGPRMAFCCNRSRVVFGLHVSPA